MNRLNRPVPRTPGVIRRRRSRVVATALAAVVALFLTAAAPVPQGMTAEQLAARGEAISNRIMELQRAGATQRTIDQAMHREYGLKPVPMAAQRSQLTEQRTQLTAAATSTSTESSCVNLPKPTAYYDTPAGAHIVSASWSWKNLPKSSTRCWVRDTSVYGGDVGGPDAFGIYLNRQVIYRSSGGNHWTERNTRSRFVNPEDWDAYGVVYRSQDRSNTGNREYTWDHGNVWMYFNLTTCAGTQTFTLKSKIGHTWSNASISSASVSASGISLTFTTTEHRWQAVNPTAGIYTPC